MMRTFEGVRSRFAVLALLLFSWMFHGRGSFAAAQQPWPRSSVMLQCFTWRSCRHGDWYDEIASRADEIAAAGVTHLWFPPPSRSVSPEGYMPGDCYDLGTDGNPTAYGTAAELRACLERIHSLGLRGLADVVMNHRCASARDEKGRWNVYHYPDGKMWWERWALVRGDFGGTGAPDTGEDFGAAPDVDHTNARVRKDYLAWLRWLHYEIGFDGYRFDFAKGYSPSILNWYVSRLGDECWKPPCVAEYWKPLRYHVFELLYDQDAHRGDVCRWLQLAGEGVVAFDFATKGILQEALKNGEYWRLRDRSGRPPGLIGWLPRRAVTFVDNHDTAPPQAHWPFPATAVLAGYAYILTHPGIPCIFWAHMFESGDYHRKAIEELLRLRRRMGIGCDSRVAVLQADGRGYLALVDSSVLVGLGDVDPPDGGLWRCEIVGDGYRVWTRLDSR